MWYKVEVEQGNPYISKGWYDILEDKRMIIPVDNIMVNDNGICELDGVYYAGMSQRMLIKAWTRIIEVEEFEIEKKDRGKVEKKSRVVRGVGKEVLNGDSDS